MRQERQSKSGHYDIRADQGIPLETYGIERIYILLSEADARRLDVATGDRVKIMRNGGSIHARVEIETDLTGEALPLFFTFDQAAEEKIAHFLICSGTDTSTAQWLDVLKASSSASSMRGPISADGYPVIETIDKPGMNKPRGKI